MHHVLEINCDICCRNLARGHGKLNINIIISTNNLVEKQWFFMFDWSNDE